MPPPPPPSKSYLINITDSDLSSDDDYDDKDNLTQYRNDLFRQSLNQQGETVRPLASNIVKTSSSGNDERIRIMNTNRTISSNIHPVDALEQKTPSQKQEENPESVALPLSYNGEMGKPRESTHNDDEDGDDNDDEDSLGEEQGSVHPKKSKNNRKRKKKKKRKKQSANVTKESVRPDGSMVTSSAETEPKKKTGGPKRRIHFGSVSIKNYERTLGTDVVPLDGGWPLGLGMVMDISDKDGDSTNETVIEIAAIDDYEAAKYDRLLHRWKKLHGQSEEHTSDIVITNNEGNKPLLEPPKVLETRQWDYKQGSRNPLFSLLIEKQRMALLLGEQSLEEIFEQKYEKDYKRKHEQKQPKSSSSPSNAGKNKKQRNGKHQQQNSPSNQRISHRRSRSGSHSFQNQERYNDRFTEFEVHHVRNELETLRNLRTKQESRGCTCRRLDVYIPPPNAGKKAAHRRLNIHKITEELRKRNALPEKKSSREELELLLHDLVAKEPCCRDDNCPCVKSGIGCQSDACQCWHASHQLKAGHSHSSSSQSNKSTTDEITPEIIQTRCGNRFGMYTVDVDFINSYRASYLTCIPVTEEMNA